MTARRGKGRRHGVGMGAAVGVVALVAAGFLVWQATVGHPPGHPQMTGYQRHPATMADMGAELPAFAMAPPDLPRLYDFAVAHPEILSYMPCTCGCAASGHHSNWNCYVKGVTADGAVVFDDMAPT